MPALFPRFYTRAFLALERLDGYCHARRVRVRGLCRLVGRMEPRFYDYTTDWDNPLYVNPQTHPALYLEHAASLCAHGYREKCPDGCQSS